MSTRRIQITRTDITMMGTGEPTNLNSGKGIFIVVDSLELMCRILGWPCQGKETQSAGYHRSCKGMRPDLSLLDQR
jgi:hypothetical protein